MLVNRNAHSAWRGHRVVDYGDKSYPWFDKCELCGGIDTSEVCCFIDSNGYEVISPCIQLDATESLPGSGELFPPHRRGEIANGCAEPSMNRAVGQ